MVISVHRSQQSGEGKTRIDERANSRQLVRATESSDNQQAEDTPKMARYGQGDFLLYSRRQVDAEMSTEEEF